MIKLSENKVALKGLNTTIDALETLDYLIKEYKQAKLGPAYCKFDCVATDYSSSSVQFDRPILVEALTKQRQVLVGYLATLGIDANDEDE